MFFSLPPAGASNNTICQVRLFTVSPYLSGGSDFIITGGKSGQKGGADFGKRVAELSNQGGRLSVRFGRCVGSIISFPGFGWQIQTARGQNGWQIFCSERLQKPHDRAVFVNRVANGARISEKNFFITRSRFLTCIFLLRNFLQKTCPICHPRLLQVTVKR